jgi:type II secretory pathway component PulM
MSEFDLGLALAHLRDMIGEPPSKTVSEARDSHPAMTPMAAEISADLYTVTHMLGATPAASLIVAAATVGGVGGFIGPKALEPGAREMTEAMGDLLAVVIKWAIIHALETETEHQKKELTDAPASRH